MQDFVNMNAILLKDIRSFLVVLFYDLVTNSHKLVLMHFLQYHLGEFDGVKFDPQRPNVNKQVVYFLQFLFQCQFEKFDCTRGRFLRFLFVIQRETKKNEEAWYFKVIFYIELLVSLCQLSAVTMHTQLLCPKDIKSLAL